LAEIASKRAQTVVGRAYSKKFDGKPYGGYYTQDEVKEVVAYAKAKFVNVIPEIEMPGHSQAVLAAYPEFGCNPDKIYQTATDWGVYEDVLCPREETFQFLENVLTEVMELFQVNIFISVVTNVQRNNGKKVVFAKKSSSVKTWVMSMAYKVILSVVSINLLPQKVVK
jgi:N-acetyl-beta-hexosaminidase